MKATIDPGTPIAEMFVVNNLVADVFNEQLRAQLDAAGWMAHHLATLPKPNRRTRIKRKLRRWRDDRRQSLAQRIAPWLQDGCDCY